MHCFAGKDRTGVLAALTLALLEVTESDIMADYALSEAAQAPIGAQIRQEFPGTPYEIPPAYVIACPPRAIALFLADLKQRYGSIYGYARAAGVTALHVEALRSHLLA
jgi:protein-tyrosine phosphatase